jgi:large subunit ribosomal protein L13
MTTSTQETRTIDAGGKRLGRVATEIASILIGKDRTDVVRNAVPPVSVTVTNASKLLIDEKKRGQKEYDWYSGYPGGRRNLSMEQLIARQGHAEVLRKAVYGMLPHNRLRAQRMKLLTIHD